MAETLTYDPAEAQPGQLSEEEQDSLRVGEEMVNQQENLLAGKYSNAQELEKAYVELESKLGKQSNESAEKVEEQEDSSETDIDSSFLDKLWDEAQKDSFNDETLETLSKMDPTDLAKMYLNQRANQPTPEQPDVLTEKQAEDMKELIGGTGEYDNMLGWASDNLDPKEIEMYDTVMNRGDPLSCMFAMYALQARYSDAVGTEGELLTGTTPSTSKGQFRSQAELVAAMSDPRYENDPAYRQDVVDKLGRSDVNF